jgi:enoyl-CoA hydratase/carnithine racemase
MSAARLQLDLTDGVAQITLDHPPLNIFDLAMRDALIEALMAARDWPDLHAVVLTTAHAHFGVGADIAEFGSAGHTLEARRIRWDRDPWWLLRRMPVPTVAALQGYTLGSGLEMALLCDLRIAAPDTVVGLPEIALAMLPAAGGTQSLTRWVGVDRSLALVLTGQRLNATEAHAIGILHEVVDDPTHRVAEIASRWTSLPRALLAATVRQLRADRAVDQFTDQSPDVFTESR